MAELHLLDNSQLVHAAWHSGRSKGRPALAQYAEALARLLEAVRPSHLIVCVDDTGETWRASRCPSYKSDRPAKSSALRALFVDVTALLVEVGITQVRAEGFEADDVIASLVHLAGKAGWSSSILGRDRDLLQLVNSGDASPAVRFVDVMDSRIWSAEDVAEAYGGLSPVQLPHVAALVGFDGVEGVPGCGQQKAVALIQWYSTVGNLYARNEDREYAALSLAAKNVEGVGPKLVASLALHEEQARSALELAVLRRDVPVVFLPGGSEISWSDAAAAVRGAVLEVPADPEPPHPASSASEVGESNTQPVNQQEWSTEAPNDSPASPAEVAPKYVPPADVQQFAATRISPELRELRRQEITGSEIGALLGLGQSWGILEAESDLESAPWVTPLDLWLNKVEGVERPIDNVDAVRFGLALEPIVLGLYLEGQPAGTGLKKPGHLGAGRVGATLDALRVRPGELDRIVEAKSSSAEWSAVPDYYVAQVHRQWHACMVADVEVDPEIADLPRFFARRFGGFGFDTWSISLDADWAEALDQVAEKFWRDYVEPKKRPPMEARDRSSAVQRLYPSNNGVEPVQATDRAEALWALLRDKYVAELRSCESAVARLEAELLGEFGAAGTVRFGDGHRMTWRNGRSTNWESVAADLGPSAELIEQHTSVDWRAVARALAKGKALAAVVDQHSEPSSKRIFRPNYPKVKS